MVEVSVNTGSGFHLFVPKQWETMFFASKSLKTKDGENNEKQGITNKKNLTLGRNHEMMV